MANPHDRRSLADLRSDLIRIAARLVRCEALPSDCEEDWPARPTGASVARKMRHAHEDLRDEAMEVRYVADRISAIMKAGGGDGE